MNFRTHFFWIIKLLSFAFTVLCKDFSLKLLISFIFNVFNFFSYSSFFSTKRSNCIYLCFFFLFFTKDLRKLMMSFPKLIYWYIHLNCNISVILFVYSLFFVWFSLLQLHILKFVYNNYLIKFSLVDPIFPKTKKKQNKKC